MARKQSRDVVVRTRRQVRLNYVAAPLDPPERFTFEMILASIVNALRAHDGLPPGTVPVAGDPLTYVFARSVLRVMYRREVDPAASGRREQVRITILQITCSRPGRPVLVF
jgi:hypothetical protein